MTHEKHDTYYYGYLLENFGGNSKTLWNLRTDDLDEQSDETIAFIHSLLG